MKDDKNNLQKTTNNLFHVKSKYNHCIKKINKNDPTNKIIL